MGKGKGSLCKKVIAFLKPGRESSIGEGPGVYRILGCSSNDKKANEAGKPSGVSQELLADWRGS